MVGRKRKCATAPDPIVIEDGPPAANIDAKKLDGLQESIRIGVERERQEAEDRRLARQLEREEAQRPADTFAEFDDCEFLREETRRDRSTFWLSGVVMPPRRHDDLHGLRRSILDQLTDHYMRTATHGTLPVARRFAIRDYKAEIAEWKSCHNNVRMDVCQTPMLGSRATYNMGPFVEFDDYSFLVNEMNLGLSTFYMDGVCTPYPPSVLTIEDLRNHILDKLTRKCLDSRIPTEALRSFTERQNDALRIARGEYRQAVNRWKQNTNGQRYNGFRLSDLPSGGRTVMNYELGSWARLMGTPAPTPVMSNNEEHEIVDQYTLANWLMGPGTTLNFPRDVARTATKTPVQALPSSVADGDEKIVGEDLTNACGICFENKKRYAFECGHLHCWRCIEMLPKNVCPECTRPFEKASIRRVFL